MFDGVWGGPTTTMHLHPERQQTFSILPAGLLAGVGVFLPGGQAFSAVQRLSTALQVMGFTNREVQGLGVTVGGSSS